jgi:hypothetical protein
MGGYSPTSKAGLDDAVDPAAAIGKQGYKRISHLAGKFANDMVNQRASGGGYSTPDMVDRLYWKRPPNPLKLTRLSGATAAGIAAESTAQNLANATRGGSESDNPYVKSLEKLASRAVGGATTGAIYGKSLPGAVLGTIGGVGYNAAEDLITLATEIAPDYYRLYKDNQELEQIRLRSEQSRKLGTKTTENKPTTAG